MKYPIYKPYISQIEKDLVNDCLETNWISSKGKYIEMFENKISEFTKSKYAVAVSNGTVALHLALLVHDIGFGDEIIIPDFTYIATANACLYVNAKPIFCDICKDTWNLDPNKLESKINSKTKAIIITNIYGNPADINEINKIAKKYNLILIEDSAESLGATYNGKMSGNLGDISTLSFFGNKTITTGEGGMVLTNKLDIYKKLLKLRNQGNSNKIRYYHDILGYNYRMTNIQAAIGFGQMNKIDEILKIKKNIQNIYESELSDYVQFQKIRNDVTSSYWMVSFLLKNQKQKNILVEYLNRNNIETRPFFIPISSMPFYNKVNNKITKDISERGINVPSFPQLKRKDILTICKKIKDIINQN